MVIRGKSASIASVLLRYYHPLSSTFHCGNIFLFSQTPNSLDDKFVLLASIPTVGVVTRLPRQCLVASGLRNLWHRCLLTYRWEKSRHPVNF